ncbi:hypothetical protein ONS96_002149 [Cadophora gregata f. sp. sojae]|nr:hypothetical protein ONS96_002149 [Cadophora gregata f. sp. sojae]
MASQTATSKQRHHCDHDGCSKSYLRVEHLNRHRLTHQERAFSCFLCKKPFTRNDLLQAHIRRHEDVNLENVDKPREITPPPCDHGDHQEPSRKRTKAGWDSSARPFAPPGEIDFESAPLQQSARVDVRSDPYSMAEPQGFPLERVIFGAPAEGPLLVQDDMQQDPEFQLDGQQMDGFDAKLMISDDLYQRLVAELPQLAPLTSDNKGSLHMLFRRGFEYMEIVMPIFHRPTCDVSDLSISVILAVCSLGGILEGNSDDHELGLVIYKHLHGSFYTVAKDQDSDWFLANIPAVLMIEHIGCYTLDHKEHVLTDVTRAMTTMKFRQGSFLSQTSHGVEMSARSLAERWKQWVESESKIRFAYYIFLADVKGSIHFMRHSMLSTSLLDLPLPYTTSIWQATTAVEWENELVRYKQATKNLATPKIGQLVALFLGHGILGHEHKLHSQDPFILEILVHAIVSKILDLGRAIPTASSKAIDLLKRSDLANGLARWKSYFDQIDVQGRETETRLSALGTYHLASILLREEISDLIAVFGTSHLGSNTADFSPTNSDDRNSKQDPSPVGKDACIHAVKIIEIYLIQISSTTVQSFYQKRTAIIACLILTTCLSKSQQPQEPKGRQVVSHNGSAENKVSQLLDLLGDPESHPLDRDSHHFEAALAVATQLVKSVRDHVATDPGDIFVSSTSKHGVIMLKFNSSELLPGSGRVPETALIPRVHSIHSRHPSQTPSWRARNMRLIKGMRSVMLTCLDINRHDFQRATASSIGMTTFSSLARQRRA